MLNLRKDTFVVGSVFLVVLVVVGYLSFISNSVVDYGYFSILIVHGISYLYLSSKETI